MKKTRAQLRQIEELEKKNSKTQIINDFVYNQSDSPDQTPAASGSELVLGPKKRRKHSKIGIKDMLDLVSENPSATEVLRPSSKRNLNEQSAIVNIT